MSKLLYSPRTAKRFFNLYLIVRDWGVSDNEVDAFVGDVEPSERCRALVLLLGVISGFPKLAPGFFRVLEQQSETATWATFRNALEPERTAKENASQSPDAVRLPANYEGIQSRLNRQWDELWALLDVLQKPQLKTLKDWIPCVRSFSVLPL